MSCNWPIVKLGDYCSKIGSGATPKGGNSVYLDHGEISLIRSQNIYNEGFKSDGLVYITPEAAQKLKNVIIEPNDVLINITGDSVARVCLAPNEFLPARVNQHVAILRVDPEEFDHRYLRYFLTSTKMQNYLLTIASTGGTRNALTKSMLESLEVSKPSLDVQKRIGDVLESFESKIELNSRTNQTLEEMAQAIFKSWFVDFDPVKAKMNGEQPEGMDAATASLFPDKLVESELGSIPEGWSASSMGEHFNITMGQSPKGETYNEEGEGIAFFQGRRDFGFRYPDVRVYTTDPKRFAKAGDTLISVRAPVGDKNMAAIDCCIGRGVAAIKHKSDSRSFTYAFMSHIEKKLGDSGSSGTVFSSINQKELKKVSFVAPPQELIEAFHKIVDPIDQKVEVLSKEIESLSSLRDTLLPKLLSGEIELDVERVNAND
ncbi:restriction endonuclease subunit S [Vibrio sp. A1-1]|uniref:restriction endonuclease subunit S n=1 Tax=Vibrio sp. A1-1 TaxID=2912250 RepID=UPI001F01C8C3|nr:restriction endonuclease subunit S [Vibrio sp. A1-1]MCF7455935.1 restriction endonuclease subunit S [Vibrio sp. A1-1]